MSSTPASAAVAGEVRAQMARRRRTQVQLAEHLGISHVTVGRRLSGESPFTVDELVAVAQFLDVDPASLLAGSAA